MCAKPQHDTTRFLGKQHYDRQIINHPDRLALFSSLDKLFADASVVAPLSLHKVFLEAQKLYYEPKPLQTATQADRRRFRNFFESLFKDRTASRPQSLFGKELQLYLFSRERYPVYCLEDPKSFLDLQDGFCPFDAYQLPASCVYLTSADTKLTAVHPAQSFLQGVYVSLEPDPEHPEDGKMFCLVGIPKKTSAIGELYVGRLEVRASHASLLEAIDDMTINAPEAWPSDWKLRQHMRAIVEQSAALIQAFCLGQYLKQTVYTTRDPAALFRDAVQTKDAKKQRDRSTAVRVCYLSETKTASTATASSNTREAHDVIGHWRNQACGAGWKERKKIWVATFRRGTELQDETAELLPRVSVVMKPTAKR